MVEAGNFLVTATSVISRASRFARAAAEATFSRTLSILSGNTDDYYDTGSMETDTIRRQIDRFLSAAETPALVEPGDDLILISPDRFDVEERGGRVVVQAWDD